MKIFTPFMMAVLACAMLPSCNQSSAENNSEKTELAAAGLKKPEIPAYKSRSGEVGSDQEASKMNNTYYEIKAQIEKNPGDYASRLKMADLFIVEARATGNYGYYYPAAITMIDGVLAENPQKREDQFRAYSSKAVILLSLHKFEEAREIGEKALAINNHNARIYGILTDANVEMGDYKQAVVMGDSMVLTRPDLRSYSRVSYLREIYGDVEGSKDAMLRAVKAGYPGHEETSWARVTLGNLYETYGDLPNAEMQYTIALQNRKGYPFAIQGLASVEAKKGNTTKAEELLKEAIKIREEAAFYEDLALLYRQTGNQNGEKNASKEALRLLKGLAATADHGHSHEGNDHDHHHETKENEHGHSHEVGLEMAKMQMALIADYDEALHNALHEYARRPDNIDVNKVLAEIYLEKGKFKQAEEHYEKAMVTNSKDPHLMLVGGMIKMKQQKTKEGKKMVQKSFEMNPYQTSPLANQAKKII